jgi:cyclopropane-fatty-acyl-phospholipid synthase
VELDRFKNIKFKKRISCVVCAKPCSQPVIRLPGFPLTEIYVNRRVEDRLGFVDQEFQFCAACGHGQIANIIDKEILYGKNYKTRTSKSQSAISAIDAFLAFIKSILAKRTPRTLLEIGANDLYMLERLRDKADILYAIDPILKDMENTYRDDKIRVIGDFFENIDIKRFGQKIDVVISSHTLEHLEEPREAIQHLLDIASDDTIFFFQFPGLEALINEAHFDQVFHQHLNYFSLQSVLFLLDEVGAELLDFKTNPYHWGTLMIAFKKRVGASKSNSRFKAKVKKISAGLIRRQYNMFNANMHLVARRIDSFNDRSLYGYGAALMLPVLEYYVERLSILKFIIDEDESKRHLYYLNLPVQIKMPDEISNIKDSVVIVTAINSMWATRAIINKLIRLNVEKIIVPVNLV